MDLGADPSFAKETIKEVIALLPKAAISIFLGGKSIPSAFAADANRRAHSRRRTGQLYFTACEAREKSIDYVLDRAIEGQNCERLYLSIDPAFASTVGQDIDELAPAYDRGETALLAARLAREFLAAKACRNEHQG